MNHFRQVLGAARRHDQMGTGSARKAPRMSPARIGLKGGHKGRLSTAAAVEALEIRRLFATTTVVPSFGTNGFSSFDSRGADSIITDMIADGTGGYLAVFRVTPIAVAGVTEQRFGVTRFLNNGVVDSNFGTNGFVYQPLDTVFGVGFNLSIAKNTGGDIYVAGNIENGSPTSSDAFVAKLFSSGSFDTSFGGDGILAFDLDFLNGAASTFVDDIEVDASGRVVLAATRFIGSTPTATVLRLDGSTGGFDASFSGDGVAVYPTSGGISKRIALDGTSILLAGRRTNSSAASVGLLLARFDDTGNLANDNTDFSDSPDVHALKIDSATSRLLLLSSGAGAGSGVAIQAFDQSSLVGDTNFGDGGTAFIDPGRAQVTGTSLDIGQDGKYYAFGNGVESNSSVREGFAARVDTNGIPDTSFGTSGFTYLSFAPNEEVFVGAALLGVGADVNSQILVFGGSVDGELLNAGLLFQGGADTNFGIRRNRVPGAADKLIETLRVSDTEAYALFESTRTLGRRSYTLVKYSNGNFDSSSVATMSIIDLSLGNYRLSEIARDPATGNIYVAGVDTDLGSNIRSLVTLRFDPSLVLDATYGSSGVSVTSSNDGTINDVEVDASGRLVFVGSFSNATSFGVGRLTTSGAPDTSFFGGGIREIFGPISGGAAEDVFVRSDGKIVVAGSLVNTNSDSDAVVAVLFPAGDLDSGFGGGSGMVQFDTGASANERGLQVIPSNASGSILYLVSSREGSSTTVYRLDGNTGDLSAGDTQFGFGGGSGVSTSANVPLVAASGQLRPDGRLLIVGVGETTSGGTDPSYLLEFNADGTRGTRYNNLGVLDLNTLYSFRSVTEAYVLPNESLVIGGTTITPFTGVDGQFVNIVGEDMTAPFGSVVSTTVTVNAGDNSLNLDVQFGEDVLLPPNLTANPFFLVITSPGGDELVGPAALNGNALTLGFTFFKASGAFDEADQGTYTVAFRSGQFVDSAGNAASGTIGTFELDVNSPDLFFTGLSRTPEAVPVGGTVSVTSTTQVSNNSNLTNSTNNGQYSIEYFLSTDTAFNAMTDISLGTVDGLTTVGTFTSNFAIPSGAVVGTTYFIIGIVDSGNGLVEENENNNLIATGQARVFIASASGVDVGFDSAQLSGNSVQQGQGVLASGTLRNTGTASSLAGTVEYYLSADSLLDGADTLLDSTAEPSILSSGFETFGASLNLDTIGSFFVLIRYVNGTGETDAIPSNNIVSLPVTVTAAPVDLVAGSVTLNQASVRAGQSLPATVQVSNSRMGSTVSGFGVSVFLSSDSTLDAGDRSVGGFISAANVGGFGGTDVDLSSLTIPSDLSPGSYFVIVVLDETNAISETDEGNNQGISASPLQVQELALTVSPTSDSQALLNALLGANSGLTIRGINVSSQSGGGGLSIGTYTNPGGIYGIGSGIVLSTGDAGLLNSGPTSTSLSTSFGAASSMGDESLLDQITGGSFGHQDVTRIDLILDLASGLDSIFFNLVLGSDEFPGLVSSSFSDAFGIFINGLNIATTGGGPLSVRTPGFAATNGTGLNGVLAPSGQPVLRFGSFVGAGATNVTLTFIIADTNGASVDTAAFISGLTAAATPGVPVANPSLNTVVAGSTDSSYTFNVTYTDDTGIAQATIDGGDIRIIGPNNFVTSVVLVSSSQGSGGTVVATYQFAAPGGSFDAGDVGLYRVVLQTGQVQDIGGTFVPAGVIGTFSVIPPATGTQPDLVITALTVNVGVYAPSQPIFFAATVANTGSVAAGAFDVTFALSTDANFSADDVVIFTTSVSSLGELGSQSLSGLSSVIPSTIVLGNYFLLAIADGTSLIAETNETNNTTSTAGAGIQVELPVPEVPIPVKPGGLDTSFGVSGVATNVFVDTPTFTTTDVRRDSLGRLVAVGVTTQGAGDFVVTRFNTDGTIDTSFGTNGLLITDLGFADRANTIQIDSLGRYVVGGYVDRTITGGSDRDIAIARYLPEGTLDTTFGTGGFVVLDLASTLGATKTDELIEAITFDGSGRLVVAGSVSISGANTDMLVGRLTEAGAPDTTFANTGFAIPQFGPGIDAALGVTVDGQGRIILAGYAATTGAVSAMAAARFKSDGTPDNSFGSSGRLVARVSITDSRAYALGVRPDGGLYLGGYSARGSVSSAAFDADFAILALTPRGQIDRNFGGGLVTTNFDGFLASITDLVVQGDGRVVASGKIASDLNSVSDPLLGVATARYTTKGDLDATYGVNGISIVFAADDTVTPARAGRDDPELSDRFDVFIESRRGKIESSVGGRIQAISDGLTPDGDTKVQIAQVLGDAADLVGAIVTKLPADVRGGVRGTGSVTVTNAGTAAATGAINVPIYISADQVIDDSDVLLTTLSDQRINLRSMRSRSISFRFVIPVNLASGQYFILADVDSTRAISENNIGNNTANSSPVAVTQAVVDLSPIFSTTPSSLTAGTRGSFSVTLTNTGNDRARGSATVRIFRSGDTTLGGDDELLGSSVVQVNLQAGRSRTSRISLDLPANLTAGQFNLVVVVEFEGDANTANNASFSATPVSFAAAS